MQYGVRRPNDDRRLARILLLEAGCWAGKGRARSCLRKFDCAARRESMVMLTDYKDLPNSAGLEGSTAMGWPVSVGCGGILCFPFQPLLVDVVDDRIANRVSAASGCSGRWKRL